jgi:hypothetical protein
VKPQIQYALAGVGYAAVFAVGALLLYRRHLWELQDPVTASSGMAAGGDMILHLFIGFLFLIPTVYLISVMAKTEALYLSYSRFLFGLSLSAPVCLGVVAFGENHVPPSLSWLCSFRIMESPIVLIGMVVSRFVARFDRSKRLVSFALLVEGLTLITPVVVAIVAAFIRR